MDLVVEREKASGRRRLGRLVQLGLKFSDLVFGAVSHQAFIGLSLRCKHVMRRGSFPRARLCCPEPSSGTMTPSDAHPARCDFPFDWLYAGAAPDDATSGPGRASPVPVFTFCPSHSPYPEEFFGACTSRPSAPSVAFAVNSAARHSLVPLRG